MYEDIKRMLAAAYELEGLLMLADSRGDNTPEMVVTAIREKIEYLANAAEGLNLPACDNTPEPTADMPSDDDNLSGYAEINTDDAEETTEGPLTEKEAEALIAAYNDTMDHQSAEEEPEAAESADREEQSEFPIEDEMEEMATAMHEYLDNLAQTEETPTNEEAAPTADNATVETETTKTETPAEEEPVEDTPAAEETADEEPETDNTENTATEGTACSTDDELAASKEEADETGPDDRITIDEVFIRNKSKNLRNAFSINDSFRFRRELFGNSAAEMADAINLAEAMQSFDEAEEYFYGDLGWDKDSEEVKEFMTIIRNHFL